MVFFITVLRALAACVITNAHYTGIYPTDLIANGGLIGDILFFAVSGYCLYNLKNTFYKWYVKRIYRVFVPTWIITSVFLILGFFSFSEKNWFHYFIYPTDYHFIASIIVLYVPYYFIVKCEALKKRLPIIMGIVAIVMLVVYVVFYDKSRYHIDTVREPFIRFLFFESMLLGAYFKHNDSAYRNRFSFKWCALLVVAFLMYFASKMYFSKAEHFLELQIFNQIIIFALLYCAIRVFSGLDGKLTKLPICVHKIVGFISDITLEIYLVQYVLIDTLRPIFEFPINWLVLTFSILCAATVLHYICKVIYRLIDALIAKFKRYNVAS